MKKCMWILATTDSLTTKTLKFQHIYCTRNFSIAVVQDKNLEGEKNIINELFILYFGIINDWIQINHHPWSFLICNDYIITCYVSGNCTFWKISRSDYIILLAFMLKWDCVQKTLTKTQFNFQHSEIPHKTIILSLWSVIHLKIISMPCGSL
jgi:hypothetical protein